MFSLPDQTHLFTAKYFTKQSVASVNTQTYTWNEFVVFRCKPVEPRYNRYEAINGGFQRAAPDSVFLETKWAGIAYAVGDYVAYNGVKYQIKSIKKDETKLNSQAVLRLKTNPNIYYVLELDEVDYLDMKGV